MSPEAGSVDLSSEPDTESYQDRETTRRSTLARAVAIAGVVALAVLAGVTTQQAIVLSELRSQLSDIQAEASQETALLADQLGVQASATHALDARLQEGVGRIQQLDEKIDRVDLRAFEAKEQTTALGDRIDAALVDYGFIEDHVLPAVVEVVDGSSVGSGFLIEVERSFCAINPGIDDPGCDNGAMRFGYDSFLITNFHVVESSSFSAYQNAGRQVLLYRDGYEATGRLWNWDEEHDLALVVFKSSDLGNAPILEWAPRHATDLGDPVAAVGSPFGVGLTISEGRLTGIRGAEYQTSAPINPGNSGGPLVDADGRVIGVATWKFVGGDDVAFAVDIHDVCATILNC